VWLCDARDQCANLQFPVEATREHIEGQLHEEPRWYTNSRARDWVAGNPNGELTDRRVRRPQRRTARLWILAWMHLNIMLIVSAGVDGGGDHGVAVSNRQDGFMGTDCGMKNSWLKIMSGHTNSVRKNLFDLFVGTIRLEQSFLTILDRGSMSTPRKFVRLGSLSCKKMLPVRSVRSGGAFDDRNGMTSVLECHSFEATKSSSHSVRVIVMGNPYPIFRAGRLYLKK
jgi:hypothetical protein